jgi:hypothetical protein
MSHLRQGVRQNLLRSRTGAALMHYLRRCRPGRYGGGIRRHRQTALRVRIVRHVRTRGYVPYGPRMKRLMPTTMAKKPQRTIKNPGAQVRGLAPDTPVAWWSTYWFQSLGGEDSISLQTTPIRSTNVGTHRRTIFTEMRFQRSDFSGRPVCRGREARPAVRSGEASGRLTASTGPRYQPSQWN